MWKEASHLSGKERIERMIKLEQSMKSKLSLYLSLVVKNELNGKLDKKDLQLLEETIDNLDSDQNKLDDLLFTILKEHEGADEYDK